MAPILASLDDRFSTLDSRSRALVEAIEDLKLFQRAGTDSTLRSCGEYVVRSAAMVERAFGGITTRLWDDPFEWTLPEKLGDKAGVLAYLDDVVDTRRKGLGFIGCDAELTRQIPAPKRLTPLIEIILGALTRASHYQGQAFFVFQLVSSERPPRF